jgi:hypothetical protein
VDEGWTRWILEQYEFSFESINDADIRRGGLRLRFDVVILPDQSADRMLTGHTPGTIPEEYTGGLGMIGASMLKQFVDAGGTLVALDSASELAMNLLGAPLRDTTKGVPADDFFCPGSIVRIPSPARASSPRCGRALDARCSSRFVRSIAGNRTRRFDCCSTRFTAHAKVPKGCQLCQRCHRYKCA